MLKLRVQLEVASFLPPNAQLRTLNPHVLQGGSVYAFPTQAVANIAGEALAGGVSSFGYSGTIANGCLVDRHDGTVSYAPPLALLLSGLRRRHFAWRDPVHPLLQHWRPDRTAAFYSSVTGLLFAIVEDHVVQGRVFFPAAAYLELARAASSALNTATTTAGAALIEVVFLQPLVVDTSDVLCELEGGRFEVRCVARTGLDPSVHCAGGAGAVGPGEWRSGGVVTRARSAHVVHAAAISTLCLAFDAMGLQYGPGYRVLARAWAAAATGVAMARLRDRVELRGMQVHPADVDAALQLSASHCSSSELRLPFAVDKAMLQDAAGELWAVAEQQGTADATSVRLHSPEGLLRVDVDRIQVRRVSDHGDGCRWCASMLHAIDGDARGY